MKDLPRARRPAAVTIGNFVGAHLGHIAIFRRLIARARDVGALPTIVTFEPHPQKVLRGEAPCSLVTPEQNLRLISKAGIERVVVLRFTPALSRLEPEAFIEAILVKELKTKAIVVGSDFKFGHFARGDVSMLRSFGRKLGFAVDGLPLARLEGRRLSSTEIRHALTEGDLAWATKALGRPYSLVGRIVRGKGRGSKLLGFPTANLKVQPGICLPKLGIYAGFVALGRLRFPAAISVGTNPAFGSNPVTVEAFVLDYRGKLIGKEVEFELIQRLRDERWFPTPRALAEAMAADVKETRRVLSPAKTRVQVDASSRRYRKRRQGGF